MSTYLKISIHICEYNQIFRKMSNKRSLNLTTILIEKSTRETLKHLARKDQTYDQLILALINNRPKEALSE